jgi:hypothetical protein
LGKSQLPIIRLLRSWLWLFTKEAAATEISRNFIAFVGVIILRAEPSMIIRTHSTASRLVVFVLLSFFTLYASGLDYAQSESANRKAQELEIRAAVIRHQMEEWWRNMDAYESHAKERWEKQTAKEENYKIYFVSLNGKDPSDEFVKRFSDVPRIVKKASSSQIRMSGSSGVLDRETQQTGIIFKANAIRWLQADTVEVDGGYYCGGRCASAITFTVHQEAGHWEVKQTHVNAVS